MLTTAKLEQSLFGNFFFVLFLQFFKLEIFERKRKKSLEDKSGARREKDLDVSENKM